MMWSEIFEFRRFTNLQNSQQKEDEEINDSGIIDGLHSDIMLQVLIQTLMLAITKKEKELKGCGVFDCLFI